MGFVRRSQGERSWDWTEVSRRRGTETAGPCQDPMQPASKTEIGGVVVSKWVAISESLLLYGFFFFSPQVCTVFNFCDKESMT